MLGALKSKKIIITGGSLGIGFAIAKACDEQGAEVIIAARDQNNLKESLRTLKAKSKKNHIAYSLDVGDLKAVKVFAEWIKNEGLEINGLVNCAGIYGPIGKTPNIDMENFTQAIRINFLGTVYMCSVFAPILVSSTNKKIVNYSGGGASSPFPNYSAYASSKVAIVRFTENLSHEIAYNGFDINCIAPGFVITRLHQKTLDAGPLMVGSGFYENTKKQIKDGGVPPDKAAALTIFLLSEDADGITGKFLSAPWDQWEDKIFQERLKEDNDLATLRRIDDKFFFKKD